MNNDSLAMGDWVLSGTLLGKPDGKEIERPPSSLAPYLYLILSSPALSPSPLYFFSFSRLLVFSVPETQEMSSKEGLEREVDESGFQIQQRLY